MSQISIVPPFGYFGSKHMIASKLSSNLPPHNCWVEVFCGSAALTLMKSPAPIEIINDIDKEIVNLFLQLRENHDELCKLIELTPYAEQELKDARNPNPIPSLSDLERARRFLVQAMMSINGVFGPERGGFSYSDSYSRNGHEARVNRWNNLPDRLKLVVDRLKAVRIENKEAKVVIRRYLRRPATLLYLDPPYFAERTNGYTNDANDEKFHRELLNLVKKAKCMIFISGYENDLYNEILNKKNGWSKKKIKTSTRDSKGKIHDRIEVIWKNKYFQKGLKTNKIPIVLTAKEKKYNKLNPERI